MRDRYGRGDNTSASGVGGGPGVAASERGQATPADGAASPATIPPEAWAPPPNPDFSTARTVLVPPRPGDLAAPRNLNTTVVKRDEQAIMVVVALVAAAFAVWSYLTESYWLTMLCAAGVLFYVWGALGARRVRLVADEDGLRIQNESRRTHRISWSDLDSIELSPRWTEDGQTNWYLDFVTRDHKRTPDHKNLYDCSPDELY